MLINGAAGGVGTIAVQTAKSFGANVTGVCSTRNVDMVRSIGADRVIDYTQEDFTKNGQRYDLFCMMTATLKMEHVFSLVRDYMHSESEAGFPSLRSIPSTRATSFFDYLENISPAERDELLDARARVTALGFVPTSAARDEMLQVLNSHPALVKYGDAMLRGPLAMGLRYQDYSHGQGHAQRR